MNLESVLKGQSHAARTAPFALLVLGIVESISGGVLSVSDAVATFFTAENCMFVRKALKNKSVDEIMGRGVQLSDLFEALEPDEANREFREELRAMQDLCRILLQRKSLAA
jgi:ClpP class serine protease